MDLMNLRKFETLSPFEIKDELIALAKKTSRTTQSAFLNAGRGNPNWIATTPREGFFLLGQFAVTESRRVMEHPAGLAGMPQPQGIAGRLEAWLAKHADMPGAPFLSSMVPFAVKTFGFEPDAFVHELVDSIIGDNYPVPDRMLVHNERIVHEYLQWAMCGSPRPAGKFDLYAVEGGTAAMCYIFKSLKANRLLHPGDTIALGTPIFTPYIEMTHLEDYALNVVNIEATRENLLPVHGRRAQEAGGPQDQGLLPREPGQPDGGRAQQGDDRQDRQPREDEAPRPDAPDRRRVRHLRPGLPLPARRAAAQHDRRLLLLEVLRLHRLAARRHRHPRGQPVRQDDRQASRRGSPGARQALRGADPRAAQGQVHRPDRRRQPRRGPQPHRRALAAPAGHDEPVLPRRADGRRRSGTRPRAGRSCIAAPWP